MSRISSIIRLGYALPRLSVRTPLSVLSSIRLHPPVTSSRDSFERISRPQRATFHSSCSVLGAWGTGLFQNDATLDEVQGIEDRIGFPIYHFFVEWEGRQEVVRTRLTPKFISRKVAEAFIPFTAIVFVACCMRLGVRIYKKDLNIILRYLRAYCRQSEREDPEQWQEKMFEPLIEAIKLYKNDGVTPWVNNDPGLFAVMMGKAAQKRDGQADERAACTRILRDKINQDQLLKHKDAQPPSSDCNGDPDPLSKPVKTGEGSK